MSQSEVVGNEALPSNFRDRRRSDRIQLPLEVRWEGISGRRVARVYDISLSGCYIETLGQVTKGERIRFEVQLPTGRWLPLQGDVVHEQPNMGFGVRLVDAPERDRRMLEQLLEYASGE